jgi:hypothetical protein
MDVRMDFYGFLVDTRMDFMDFLKDARMDFHGFLYGFSWIRIWIPGLQCVSKA